MIKWLYESDYQNYGGILYIIAKYWLGKNYRVFVQGYNTCNCWEIKN